MHARRGRNGARLFGIVLMTTALLGTVGLTDALAAAPTITSFDPPSGPVGTVVTIMGAWFQDASVATGVTFNGAAAITFTVDSDAQIRATVPAGATTGAIAVTDSEGTATSATNFTVSPSPAPTIGSFDPTSGPVGTGVTITGTGFMGATKVEFGGTSAAFTAGSDVQISATVPAGAVTGHIKVTTPGGTAESSTNFTVTAAPVPAISSFDPTSGSEGTDVTITGTGFTGVTAVTFGGVAATFTEDSDTQITAPVPAGALTGPIAVTTPGGTGTSSSDFVVTPPVVKHTRDIALKLRKHLVAAGRVRVDDGTAECRSRVPVEIQRKGKNGGWKTIDEIMTTPAGAYVDDLKDKQGRYRAVATKFELDNGELCARAVSRSRNHRH